MATCAGHLRSLLDNASDLIQAIDLNGKIIYANSAWRQVLGYSQTEIDVLSFFDLLVADSGDRYRQALQAMQNEPSEHRLDVVLRAKNGTAIAVSGTVNHSFTQQGSGEIWSLWKPLEYLNRELEPTRFQPSNGNGSFSQRHGQSARQEILHTTPAYYQQIEAAFQRSETLYRAIVEDQTELVCRFLPDGTLTFANKAYCQVLGISQAELAGHSYKVFLMAPDQTHNSSIETSRMNNPVRWFEHQVILPTGEVRWQQWSSRAIFDDRGNCVEFQAVGCDVTQRKRMEEALRESEARFQAFMDNSPVVAFMKEEAGRLVYVNAQWERLHNKTRAEVVGCEEVGLFPNEILQRLFENDRQVLTTRQAAEFIEIVPDVNGNLREFLVFKFPLSGANGQRLLGGVGVDITERRQAEAELKAMSVALSNAVEGISLLDAQGRYTQVNQAYASPGGYLPEELIGKPWQMTVHPDDLDLLTAAYDEMRRTGKAEVEGKGLHKDGSFYYKHIVLVAIYNEQQQFAGHYCFMRNISDRKQAEVEVLNALAKEKELNELKSRFVAMVSHEFRTPLTTIQSATELLQYYEWEPDEKQERFQQIHAAVQHMTQLLEDVLLIGKAEAGRLDFNPKLLDLNQFCHRLLADIQMTIGTQHSVTFINCGQPQAVCVDPKLLRQILTNLLSNAVKYSPQGGLVELGLDYGLKNIQIWVKDLGIGIPPQAKDHLFEAFFRAKNVNTIHGTGLGLAIVKKCVDLHQGSITVDSDVGSGTTFTVTLPMIAAED